MPDPTVALIRQAYAAYARGDTAAMLDLVDPNLEWTYLDPSDADPRPPTARAGCNTPRTNQRDSAARIIRVVPPAGVTSDDR